MSRFLTATAMVLSMATPVLAAGSHSGGHDEEMAIGRPGDPANVGRVVDVAMAETDDGEMIFDLSDLKIEEGETVRFVVTNTGQLEHEFVLDTHEKNQEHKALMEEFPEMEHDDPNSIRLEPGETGELVWTFANDGSFEFACLIPGHYEAGMNGSVVVN